MQPNTTQEPGGSLSVPMIIGGAILAILILGGLYFWQTPATMESSYSDVDSESWMPASSGSDEAAAIRAELEATSMTEFENSMNADTEATVSNL